MRSESQAADTVHPHVVIVTALASNRKIYSQLAVSAGSCVEVNVFTDTSGAIGWLDHRRANLVISDDYVSGIDGSDNVRQLTGRGANGCVPIVVVTSRQDWLSQQQILEAGAIDVWRSPLDIPVCGARVRSLLRLTDETSRRHAHRRRIGE